MLASVTIGRDRRALEYVLRLGCKNVFWLSLPWEPKIDNVDIRNAAVWQTGVEIVEDEQLTGFVVISGPGLAPSLVHTPCSVELVIWNLLSTDHVSHTDSSFTDLSITTLKLPSVVMAAGLQAGSAKFMTELPVVVRGRSRKRIGLESVISYGYILVTLFSTEDFCW